MNNRLFTIDAQIETMNGLRFATIIRINARLIIGTKSVCHELDGKIVSTLHQNL